jgi:hypothetical protein
VLGEKTKMAAEVRNMLSGVSGLGTHKDATGKYREILNKIFKFPEPRLTDGMKVFIEAGEICIKTS